MNFKITNDPNYEQKERARLEQQRKEAQIAAQRQQGWKNQFLNACLDQVQRALDYRQYTVCETRGLFTRRRYLKIVLGSEYRYSISNKEHPKLPLMRELAAIIQSKYPQWQVAGFHYDNPADDSSDDGSYGITIYGIPGI